MGLVGLRPIALEGWLGIGVYPGFIAQSVFACPPLGFGAFCVFGMVGSGFGRDLVGYGLGGDGLGPAPMALMFVRGHLCRNLEKCKKVTP